MTISRSVDSPVTSSRTADAAVRGPLRFVLASVPSDSHTWNLVALQLIIEEMGHEVTNLGACVPVDRLLAACRAERPDCLVVSTVNGHGRIDGARVIRRLREDPALAGLTAVIGGKLGVDGRPDPEVRRTLVGLGFDEVFQVDADDPGEAMRAFGEFVATSVGRVR